MGRDVVKPLAIDLFCGLGGWTEGLLAEGYRVVGFDIERHAYGDHQYPAQLVLQDVTTLDGAQFKSAALIVASPPCQGYSYRAMPWSRAKALPPPGIEVGGPTKAEGPHKRICEAWRSKSFANGYKQPGISGAAR